jgi:hypothetical protein
VTVAGVVKSFLEVGIEVIGFQETPACSY